MGECFVYVFLMISCTWLIAPGGYFTYLLPKRSSKGVLSTLTLLMVVIINSKSCVEIPS